MSRWCTPIAVAFVVAAACSTFAGVEEPGVSVPDAGNATDAADAVGSSDAGSSADADGDAGDGARSFCVDGAAASCDDFERDETDLAGLAWSLDPPYGTATLVIDRTRALSPVRSLRAKVISDAGSAGRRLSHAYAMSPDVIEVSFAMFVAAVAEPSVQVAGIAFTPPDGGTASAVHLAVESDGTIHVLEEFTSGEGVKQAFGPPIQLGVFRRYTLRVDRAGRKAILEIEGKLAPVVLSLDIDHGTPKGVRLGIVYAPSQTKPFEVWFDDVAVHR